jgi:hypothetical protein
MMDNEGDETSVSELKRMIIRMIKEFKEDMQKQVNGIKRMWINSSRRHRNS